jgi:hypothetical protein
MSQLIGRSPAIRPRKLHRTRLGRARQVECGGLSEKTNEKAPKAGEAP